MNRLVRPAQYFLLLIWSFVCLFPIYWLTLASLKSPDDQFDGPSYAPFVDFQPTLEAWSFILADPYENLLCPAFNSIVRGTSATVITLLLAGFVVYGVTRFPVRNNKFRNAYGYILLGLLATRIVPPIAMLIPLYFMAKATGTLDTVFSLIVTYAAVNLPVAIWLLRPVLGERASEMEESAMLEGASHLRIFFEFVLPTRSAGFAAVGLIVFILCWNEYLVAAYLATDHAMTLPPWAAGQLSMKEAQVGGEAEEWAHMSAATVLMMLPVLFIASFVQKSFSRATIGR